MMQIQQMQDKYLKIYRKCVFIANKIDTLVAIQNQGSKLKEQGSEGAKHCVFDDEVIAEINRIKPVVAEFEVLRSKKFELMDKMHQIKVRE